MSTAVVAAGLILSLAPRFPVAAAGQKNGAASPANQAVDPGASTYAENCAVCHGKNREGNLPDFPPLAGVKRQLSDQQITKMVRNGKGAMPPFPDIPDDELAALLKFLGTTPLVGTPPPAQSSLAARKGIELSPAAAAGGVLFQQNCGFCHGRDAMGGETGPDLTRSKLVLTDSNGSKISEVITDGRTNGDKKMPAFRFSDPELAGLVAFIRARVTAAAAMSGGRRGVDVSDLQTGDVQAGKQYFNGAGGCAKCHSPSGDLAGIASRYEGLQLEERMLYPKNVQSKVTVTLRSGQKVTGTLAYHDEFTIALIDHDGTYKSWPINSVKYTIDSPVDAHVELFSRYTDDDIHNLMAYIQTLR